MRIYNQLLAAFVQLCQNGAFISTVKRAWQLVQAEAVQKVNEYAGGMINGIVKDGELHAVVIDSEHIRYSSCTCQQSQFCEHIGALFFQYCKTLENGKVLAEQAYFQMLGVVKAVTIEREENEFVINQHTDVSQLFYRLSNQFGDDWKKCKHSFHPLSQTLTNIKSLARHSEFEVQRLHWCASILFVFYLGERALQAADSFSRYYHEISFKRIAEPWNTQLYEWLDQLGEESLQPFQQRWMKELIHFTYVHAEQYEKPMLEWDHILYRLMTVIAGQQPIEGEVAEELLRKRSTMDRPQMLQLINGSLAVLAFQANDDERALSYIQQCQFDKVQRLVYPMVESRMASESWEKVSLWMTWLMKQFNGGGQQLRSVGPFLALCRKAISLQPHQRQWLDAMLALLPHSYQALTDHYYTQGQYSAWADLQMYMGRKPEDFKGTEIQKIEQKAPKVLLPMYHQAIELAIHSRNRQGYRMAAKYMIKLNSLYEQLGERRVWHSYYKRMQDKYSRLRAFQEELVKGKLVE